MKKNSTMRVAALLMTLTLVTTCFVGATFAKYVTTADATDSARVAKWGVNVTAEGNDAFAIQYDDETGDNGTQVKSTVKVVAPGTKGDLAAITIEGTPEVVVDVDVNATLTLTGWEILGDWDNDPATPPTKGEYCPIVFTIGTKEFKIDGTTITGVAGLKQAVEDEFNTMDKTSVAVGNNLADTIDISWEWDFDDNGAGTNDEKDTALGNLATAPTITFACDVTVTQVD